MKKISALVLLFIALSFPSHAARDFSKIEINAQSVASGVYMLSGSGGNIGVFATDEGLVLIDDQFAPLAAKIETAMKTIKAVPLKYIINTHYHGDHTGANGHFGKQAPIFAHSNVRKRVKEDNKKSGVDLPVVTYEHGVTIYLGDEEIQVMHFPNGHTDGDSIVYFKKANVLHMGDLFFQGRFPFIDLKAGGTVKGYLANIKKISNHFSPDVKIIPGHGELTDMKGLMEFIDMVEYSVNKVDAALQEGADSGEIMANGIGDKYKGWAWNFISEERWLKTLITDLKKSE